jgi:hypothetical protein
MSTVMMLMVLRLSICPFCSFCDYPQKLWRINQGDIYIIIIDENRTSFVLI